MIAFGDTVLSSASGTGDSADRWGCPGVHELPDAPGRRFVISRDDVADDERAALAEHVGHDADGRPELLGSVPPWVPSVLMDLSVLGSFMDAHLDREGTSAGRMETLPSYAPGDTDYAAWLRGDAPDADRKQAWLDRLAADHARSVRHFRVRRLPAELTDYQVFACRHGYARNAVEGHEGIRVLRDGEHAVPAGLLETDYWLVNGTVVVPMLYDGHGGFVGAGLLPPGQTAPFRDDLARAWDAGEPWAEWWARHPEFHGRESPAA